MLHRKLKYGILSSLLALCFVLFNIIAYAKNDQTLKIVFLDVGQGDAILISEGPYQMLVDGGRDGKLLMNKLGKYIPFWDRNVEVLLATHPDADHIAGLINTLESYKVGATIETGFPSDSLTYKELEEKIVKEKSENIRARQGIEIKFPESGAVVKLLYPFGGDAEFNKNQSNESSIVARVEVGENSFLLTGDLPKNKEVELISSKVALNSRVLKVAHHGSKYSTGAEFLDAVNPKDAIISVGKNNPYGHPNEEVLQLLQSKNIKILRTDEKGDIVYKCEQNSACEMN